jgi:hypothetical protein
VHKQHPQQVDGRESLEWQNGCPHNFHGCKGTTRIRRLPPPAPFLAIFHTHRATHASPLGLTLSRHEFENNKYNKYNALFINTIFFVLIWSADFRDYLDADAFPSNPYNQPAISVVRQPICLMRLIRRHNKNADAKHIVVMVV